MAKSYKAKSLISCVAFSCESAIRQNKWKIILTTLLSVAAIVFGIIVAAKADFAQVFKSLQEINIAGFQSGFVASSSAFFARCFSLLFNILLLFLLSLSPFLFPLAEILLAYRGYLFGLNFALIFIFYGLGSMISAIVIVFPCQIATLFVLILFYIILFQQNKNSKKFGSCDCSRGKLILTFAVIVLVLNLVETLLLFLLSGKVIMVI